MWFWVTQQNRQRQFELYVLRQRDLKNDLEHKKHENKRKTCFWGCEGGGKD